MKRVLSLVLVVAMVLSLSACGGEKTKSSGDESKEIVVEHTGKKIKGEITAASVFSNGLAFVCLDGNKEKAYCIDKQGNIVFELENKIQPVFGEIYEKFINGYALVDGGICDITGKITYPQDVGATYFYGVALNGGYIIATKETADYSSSKKELGIMNTDFEWVLQPSETIYNELSENLWTISAQNTESFFANGIVYFDGCKKYLNVKTGEVSDSVDSKFPSETWKCYTDNTFRNSNEEIMVNLSNLSNIESTGNNTYKNGKVPVIFLNQQAGKRFWTLVDEKGEFLFEPVEMVDLSIALGRIVFDGKNTVFYDKSSNKLSCFDEKGKLLGELNDENLSSAYIENGVILVISGGMNSKKCHYYNTDFSPLF